MTSKTVDGVDKKEDEGGGNTMLSGNELTDRQIGGTCVTTTDYHTERHGQQPLDIFVKHVDQLQQQQNNRRSSLPADAIELPTLNGVVMRRKQQLQLRYQQQIDSSKHLSPGNLKVRPLSISSLSSAASSGFSSSTNSSASSGIQSSLTRNSSLNYGHDYRKCAYLASIESLNNPQTSESRSIEAALETLNLTNPGQFKDAAARAAVLVAGAQSRGFGASGKRISRINRSLHASLRYDKNTAYRIHLIEKARALTNSSNTPLGTTNDGEQPRRGGTISRNNSSTSSDSGHPSNNPHSPRFACRCRSNPSMITSSSASKVDQISTKSPGYWDSNLSNTQRVVTEIIETERTYVDDLEQIVTNYICYLRNVLKKQTVFDDDTTSAEVDDYDVEEAESDTYIDEAIMTATHIKNLFSNLEDIYKFNKDLLFRLEECYLNPSSVAECFVENASGFEVYTHYCTMYPQVVSTLTELMSNQASAQSLRERQSESKQSLPLGAYLLKPVQRILKYHILFQSLIKHTTDDDTVDEKDRLLINEAFSVMTNIARHINDMKKQHEHAIRVQEVQGLLSGWDGPDLTTLGELILEDTFKLYNRSKSNRHLFLFDGVLLITKKKYDGSLCYKGHIACSNLMLIENIEGQPLVFNTVPFDNPKALCAFQAKNLNKKRDWCLQMKEVIIKSFEVEIPVHVRDILMSLTKSNTADTSSKSSSETTRVLRAPNYLEKKRIKQDKKK